MDKTPSSAPIIIISGPPGAGKSTVAREFVAQSEGPTACIEGDRFWSFFVRGRVGEPRLDNFKTIMRAMTNAAVPFALAGYETVLDFSIPPWYLEAVRRITSARQVPVRYVVLRPSESVCAERVANRAKGAVADYAVFRDLYRSFDNAASCTISDETIPPAETARLIQRQLDAGEFTLR
jgi:adenylate kinase family enzyme